jgi:hypothetical protein
MENKVDYTFTRAGVEKIVGKSITDKQWEVMASELEDALDYYFNDETPRLWQDIDYLVEQDSKSD